MKENFLNLLTKISTIKDINDLERYMRTFVLKYLEVKYAKQIKNNETVELEDILTSLRANDVKKTLDTNI